jgi:hypothetical protein
MTNEKEVLPKHTGTLDEWDRIIRRHPTCAIPDCELDAVAEFKVGKRAEPQCGLHGYLVMSQLGGATTDKIYDNAKFWKMIDALRADGHVVAVEGVGRAS